jgi:hypothetical protein
MTFLGRCGTLQPITILDANNRRFRLSDGLTQQKKWLDPEFPRGIV